MYEQASYFKALCPIARVCLSCRHIAVVSSTQCISYQRHHPDSRESAGGALRRFQVCVCVCVRFIVGVSHGVCGEIRFDYLFCVHWKVVSLRVQA